MAAEGPHITDGEWTKLAPGLIQQIASGPGVAPAQHMAKHSASLQPFSYPKTVVVDMGCGPGAVTNAILEAHHEQLAAASAQIIGADNNAGMMAQYGGRKKAEIEKGNTWWERVELREVDIHDCSAAFADDSVTHMLCGLVVFLVPEPAKALASMKRVMAPGGVLAMSSMASSEWLTLATYPAEARPDLGPPLYPTNGCHTPEGAVSHLQEAGFRDIEIIETQCYMEFTDYETVIRFIMAMLPTAARVLAQMTKEEVAQVKDKMIADLKTWHPEVPGRMTGKIHIAYCRK
ncbi:S-adenosyl-L-methionine-dependent methyltransferase [Xylariaceae sp. FL0804]|nr:S-adenosyl-L-methionine-dependent methyltransferase [Xylariaceae sp. FL0804]